MREADATKQFPSHIISYIFIFNNSKLPFSNFLFFEAFSRFPLYLFGDGLRFAPPAAKKDAFTIGARIVVILSRFVIANLR